MATASEMYSVELKISSLTPFWLYKMDCEDRYGKSRGTEVAHETWTNCPIRDWYKSLVTTMKRSKTGTYTPDARRAPAGHNYSPEKSHQLEMAWQIVKSERAGGIGLDMTDLDHLLDVYDHGDHLK